MAPRPAEHADHAGTVKRIKSRGRRAFRKGGPAESRSTSSWSRWSSCCASNGEPGQDVQRSGNFVTIYDVDRGEWARMWWRFTMLACEPEGADGFRLRRVAQTRRTIRIFYVPCRPCRIRSTLRTKAAAEGLAPSGEALELLGAEEIALIKQAAQFPRVVKARLPRLASRFRIAFFLYDLPQRSCPDGASAAIQRLLHHGFITRS